MLTIIRIAMLCWIPYCCYYLFSNNLSIGKIIGGCIILLAALIIVIKG